MNIKYVFKIDISTAMICSLFYLMTHPEIVSLWLCPLELGLWMVLSYPCWCWELNPDPLPPLLLLTKWIAFSTWGTQGKAHSNVCQFKHRPLISEQVGQVAARSRQLHTQGFLALCRPAHQAGSTPAPSWPSAAGTQVDILSTFWKHVDKGTEAKEKQKPRKKTHKRRWGQVDAWIERCSLVVLQSWKGFLI